jgi:hypothetical protein
VAPSGDRASIISAFPLGTKRWTGDFRPMGIGRLIGRMVLGTERRTNHLGHDPVAIWSSAS